MMKPEILPMIRDGGRLLVLDIEETALSRKQRERRLRRSRLKQCGSKRSMREVIWPNARWWRYVPVRDQSDFPESSHPDRDHAVVDAWQNLACVSGWDSETLADLIFILIETPSVERTCALPLPTDSAKGSDLRPWLSDRRAIRDLLCRMADCWLEAINRLEREGRINCVASKRLRNWSPSPGRCYDPYVLVHFGHREEIIEIDWKEREVRSTLAFFRGGTIRQVRAANATIEAILESDPSSATLVQRFLLGSNFSTAAPWVRFAGFFSEDRHRRHYFERLSHSTATRHLPCRAVDPLVQMISKRARNHGRETLELASLFAIVENGIDPEILADMFQLSAAITSHDSWIELPRTVSGRPSIVPLIEAGRSLVKEEGHRRQVRYRSGSNIVLRLWKASLNSPPLRAVIDKRVWDEFPGTLTRDLFLMLLQILEVSNSASEFRWVLKRNLQSIRKFDRRKQVVRIRAARFFLDQSETLPDRDALDTLDLFADTMAKGFTRFPESAARLFLAIFRNGNQNQRWALGGLTRSTIKNMEDASRSYGSAQAILEAVPAFLRALPRADLGIFFRQPRQLMKLLKKLGGIPESERANVIARENLHPAIQVDPFRVDLREACFLFDTVLAENHLDPIPQKLRDFAYGRIQLRDVVLAHYRNEFADRLASLWLEILNDELEHFLDGVRQRNLDPHTIRFVIQLGKSNKRGLKRFLSSLEAGNKAYRDNHPANRTWLRQHSRLSLDGWTRAGSPSFSVGLPRTDAAFIRLEDDPQEELKMGTYVDTCLGIGGCNQHSAVANTLDINKRIAYLRNDKGNILARQLLAISEEEKLVPFVVYRTQNDVPTGEIERVFQDFDRHLAEELGIPLLKKEADYTVRSLVVPDWYDDYAWEVDA